MATTGKRGRKPGMYKDGKGLWHYADGSLTPSSAAKIGNNSPPSITPTPMVKVPENGAQSVTEDTVFVQRNYGTRIHSNAELKAIEAQTGLKCGGFFADTHGCQIPIFLKSDHSEDEIASKLAKARSMI